MGIIAQDTSRNNTIFKVDPEFRDKIPPLTDAEFEQLRENILRDGEVYEPICVWNGVIVDGHNRWKIVQEHPEIPYKVKELDFADKWAAIEWMCKNQLGRRNLSDAQQTYLRGKMYEARKKSVGNTSARNADGTFGGSQLDQNDPIGDRPHSTAEAIAREVGVAEPTIKRAGEFAAGLDKAEETVPGFKDEVLSGKVNTPKTNIRSIRKLESEEDVKAAVEAIRNPPPKPHKPKAPADPEAAAKRAAERELKERIHEIAEDMRKTDIAAYTQKDLERDLTLITERGDANSLKSPMLRGTAMFVDKYRGEYVKKQLIDRLNKNGPVAILQAGKASAANGKIKYAREILAVYNRGRKNPLPDKF